MEYVSWSVFSCPQPTSPLLHRGCSATSPYKCSSTIHPSTSADSRRGPASTALFPTLSSAEGTSLQGGTQHVHIPKGRHTTCAHPTAHTHYPLCRGSWQAAQRHRHMSYFHCLRKWVVDIAVVEVVRQIYVASHCYQTVTNDSEATIMGN